MHAICVVIISEFSSSLAREVSHRGIRPQFKSSERQKMILKTVRETPSGSYAVDEHGNTTPRKTVRRGDLLELFAQWPACARKRARVDARCA